MSDTFSTVPDMIAHGKMFRATRVWVSCVEDPNQSEPIRCAMAFLLQSKM
jgi:hypothetical protein